MKSRQLVTPAVPLHIYGLNVGKNCVGFDAILSTTWPKSYPIRVPENFR